MWSLWPCRFCFTSFIYCKYLWQLTWPHVPRRNQPNPPFWRQCFVRLFVVVLIYEVHRIYLWFLSFMLQYFLFSNLFFHRFISLCFNMFFFPNSILYVHRRFSVLFHYNPIFISLSFIHSSIHSVVCDCLPEISKIYMMFVVPLWIRVLSVMNIAIERPFYCAFSIDHESTSSSWGVLCREERSTQPPHTHQHPETSTTTLMT